MGFAMRPVLWLSLLALGVVAGGCAGTSAILGPPAATDLPGRSIVTRVPFYPQESRQCGPAALSMALAWSGVDVSPERLASEVFTPALAGSLQSAMIGAVRRHGRIACPLAGPESLIREIAAGHPVIVLQNLGLSWYPVWHYALVIGVDREKGTVMLHSGKTPRKRLSVDVFEKTWARSGFWGLLVLPPTLLPADADENRYVGAVNGLERAGHWKTAVRAYQTALTRWPDSFLARMGIGVCHYRLGDLESAENVFRDAIRTSPGRGAAYNNLAQVLQARGRNAEALAAVRKAMELGGPLGAHFKETLEEIQRGQEAGDKGNNGEGIQ